jgi:hypothetical protein
MRCDRFASNVTVTASDGDLRDVRLHWTVTNVNRAPTVTQQRISQRRRVVADIADQCERPGFG